MQTMLGVEVQQLPPVISNGGCSHGDISGIIGMVSETINGSVALSFPVGTAVEMYKKMMGEATSNMDEIKDTVGEFANIIAGGAKRELAGMGMSFNISIPTIVMGKDHTLCHQANAYVIVIPFKFDGGNQFEMEISLKMIQD